MIFLLGSASIVSFSLFGVFDAKGGEVVLLRTPGICMGRAQASFDFICFLVALVSIYLSVDVELLNYVLENFGHLYVW